MTNTNGHWNPRYDNIPLELRSLPIWLRWKLKERQGADKPTKVPYKSDGSGLAKTNDPATWSSFEDAAKHKVGDGLGCMVKGGYAAIDLGECRDPQTRKLEDWAQSIVDEIGSYIGAAALDGTLLGLSALEAFNHIDPAVLNALQFSTAEHLHSLHSIDAYVRDHFFNAGRCPLTEQVIIPGCLWLGSDREKRRSSVSKVVSLLRRVVGKYLIEKQIQPIGGGDTTYGL